MKNNEINQVLEQLNHRQSKRLFKDKEIPNDIKNSIFKASIHAPTACNQNLSTIIDITTKEKKEAMAKASNQSFVKDAPMLALFTIDWYRYYSLYEILGFNPKKPDMGNFVLGFQDALIAAHNSVIAAESMGLGTCYIGMIVQEYDFVREVLSLPSYVFPAIMVVYGYPKEEKISKRPRFPYENLVHSNAYRKMPLEELIEIHNEKYKELSHFDFNTFIKKHYETKYENFGAEMNLAAKKYMEDFNQ